MRLIFEILSTIMSVGNFYVLNLTKQKRKMTTRAIISTNVKEQRKLKQVALIGTEAQI